MLHSSEQKLFELTKCTECELSVCGAPKPGFVFGHGPTTAKIAFVGESPTGADSRARKLMVGNSGKLLDNILEQIPNAPKRKDIYQATALLCNYKDKPKTESVLACKTRLIEELKHLPQLKVVVAFGGLATTALTGNKAVSKQIYDVVWNEELSCLVIPVYHPGFVFMNIEAFEDLVWAIEKAVDLAHRGAGKEITVLPVVETTILSTADAATKFLLELSRITEPTWCAVDWESDNVDVGTTSTLALGFCTEPGRATIIPWVSGDPEVADPVRDLRPTEDMTTALRRAMRNPNLMCIFHNGDFDTRLAWHQTGIRFHVAYDTLLSSYVLDERGGNDELEGTSSGVQIGSHRLKGDAKRYLGAPDWEGDIKKYLKNSNVKYSHIPRSRLYRYLSYDVHYTYLLREAHERILLADEPSRKGYWTPHKRLHELLIPAQNELISVELDGVEINREEAFALQSDTEREMFALQTQIRNRAVELGWPAAKRASFNINSPQQLKTLIYDIMKIPLTSDLRISLKGAKIDTEFPTGKDVLTKLKDRDPFFELVLKYKALSHFKSGFLDSALSHSETTGRVHSKFLLAVSRTGRLSSRDPNLQNQTPASKVLYGPDADDTEPHVLVNGDYKQLEVRVAAIYSRDKNLIKACKGDIHGEISKKVFARQYEDIRNAGTLDELRLLSKKHTILGPLLTKLSLEGRDTIEALVAGLQDELRNAAKPIIFGVIYGREAASLAAGPLQCKVSEAQAYIDSLFAEFSDLHKWLELQKSEVEKYGWIESKTGQRRRFSFITDDFKSRILKQTVNAPIQGFASDICLASFVSVAAELREKKIGRVKFPVHDAILSSLRESKLHTGVAILKAHMEGTVTDPDVKLEVDFKVGKNYRDMTKYKVGVDDT